MLLKPSNWKIMGDQSPKNKHKLEDRKHEEHVKKDEVKHENAERQHHHPPTLPTPEQIDGLAKTESA
jgi:hypothetical protein